MTAEQIAGFSLTLLLMGVGMIGNLLPGVPGTPLVLLAAVGHRLYFGESSVSNSVLALLVVLTLLALGVDYLASVVGAKKLGATWRGMLGAVVGAVVGIFFSLPGIILGPFLGALLFEYLGGRDVREATLAGAGAMLGVFIGALGKVACSAAMIGLFAASVWSRSGRMLEAFLVNVAGGGGAG